MFLLSLKKCLYGVLLGIHLYWVIPSRTIRMCFISDCPAVTVLMTSRLIDFRT